MNFEIIREYCLKLKGTEECFPFDESTLVFKTGGKMFLLLDLESNPPEFNVKCDPEKAIELRESYQFVNPGFHMNKKHWNTVTCLPNIPHQIVLEMIFHSYELVSKKLPLKHRLK